MDRIKNWLLPILLIVAAFAEEHLSLIKEAVTSFGISPKWIVFLKLSLGFIGIVILKLQNPSLKKAKQIKEGYHPKQ